MDFYFFLERIRLQRLFRYAVPLLDLLGPLKWRLYLLYLLLLVVVPEEGLGPEAERWAIGFLRAL